MKTMNDLIEGDEIICIETNRPDLVKIGEKYIFKNYWDEKRNYITLVDGHIFPIEWFELSKPDVLIVHNRLDIIE